MLTIQAGATISSNNRNPGHNHGQTSESTYVKATAKQRTSAQSKLQPQTTLYLNLKGLNF